MCLASAVGMVGGEGLFRLVCLLGLVSFRPRRFLGARGHPGIVFGRATPRRDAGRLAAQPLRHVGEVLPRGFAGARRQHNAGKTQQHRFETRRGTIHHQLIVKGIVAIAVRNHGGDAVQYDVSRSGSESRSD